jgi:hypothetical protein
MVWKQPQLTAAPRERPGARSDPMPLDDNGTAPADVTITFRPSAN